MGAVVIDEVLQGNGREGQRVVIEHDELGPDALDRWQVRAEQPVPSLVVALAELGQIIAEKHGLVDEPYPLRARDRADGILEFRRRHDDVLRCQRRAGVVGGNRPGHLARLIADVDERQGRIDLDVPCGNGCGEVLENNGDRAAHRVPRVRRELIANLPPAV